MKIYMDVMPTTDVLVEFLESGIANINFKAEQIFSLVFCFLTLEHDIICFSIENVQHELFVDLQNKNIAASTMRLDERTEKKMLHFPEVQSVTGNCNYVMGSQQRAWVIYTFYHTRRAASQKYSHSNGERLS